MGDAELCRGGLRFPAQNKNFIRAARAFKSLAGAKGPNVAPL